MENPITVCKDCGRPLLSGGYCDYCGDNEPNDGTPLSPTEEQDVADDNATEKWTGFDYDEFNDIDSGRWDDDPSPYDGTYSEE